MILLEMFGAIFSILGAWYMSTATKKSLYKAFTAFLISNGSLLLFFLINGKIPMVIQFIFFFATAILGLYRTTEDKEKTKRIVFLALFILCLGVIYPLFNLENINLTVLPLDTVASSLAILGAFLLSSSSYTQRNIAYALFVIADIIFVYIGYINGFWFFLTQSAWFIFTGSKGLLSNIKLNKFPS